MISESIKKYVERKAFENIIVKNLAEQMEELYAMRREMDDCLRELDDAIKDAEKDFLRIVDKTGD